MLGPHKHCQRWARIPVNRANCRQPGGQAYGRPTQKHSLLSEVGTNLVIPVAYLGGRPRVGPYTNTAYTTRGGHAPS